MAVALAASARDAAADEKETCAASYEQGQRLQRAGSLRAAREQYLVCAQEPCAAFVRADCTKWLADVDAALPAITFVVQRCDGAACVDVAGASVTVDGAAVDVRNGRAVPLDPGDHVVVASAPGLTKGQASFSTHESERKVVEVRLSAVPPPPAAPRSSRIPTASWVLGGVGVAALATFGTFAALGRSEHSSTLEDCRGACSSDEVDSVRTKYIVADVSLAVSVVALGLATYFFVTSRRPMTGAALAW